MLEAGIVLFVIGILVMILATGEAERLGQLVAVIGIAVIVLAILLDVLDDDDGELGALLPLALVGRLRF